MASPIKQLLSPKVLTPLLKSASTLHADSLFKNISRNEAKPLNFEKPIQTTPIKARASVPPGCVIGLTVRNEKGEYLLINTPNKNILLNNGLYTKHNITVLGKGSFGVVVKGIYRDEQVAVKIVKLHNSSTLNEKNALHLAHENIVKVVDVILNPNGNYGIVLMEYIKSAQSLQSIMDDKHISITNDITKTFALGICKGLQYCHTNSILHLDVKPNNILVCENNICKLCDFGNSVDVNNINETYQHQGTVAFTAPEILMGRQATAKCDIYSLGIVFWQLRYRSPPYEMVDEPEVIIYKIEGERPQPRTVKNRLSQKYGDDILIVESASKQTTVCFKNTGHKILTSSWYESKSPDPQAERLRVVKAAAEIIREDIRSQVYDTNTFTPSDDFLQDVHSVIPESLSLLLETVILKDKRGRLDVFKKKCVALAHSIISAVRPRSFISSLLHGIGVYLYHKFGAKHLVELLSTLGFSASYRDTSLLEASAIMRPDKLILKDPSFLQFTFDNADFNVSTLDGLGTFHAMGGIQIVTPYDSVCPEERIARLKNCTADELVRRNPSTAGNLSSFI